MTYAGGFALLAPFKGKLTEIDLGMCLVSEADLAKLKADHPQANIIMTPVADMPKRNSCVAGNVAKQAPPDVAAPLNAAIEEFQKNK